MMLKLKRFLQALGPGFITAAVVLGPGSLTTSTKIGATQGYEFLWAIVIAGVSMAVYTGMSTRFAVMNEESILGVIAQKFGKWFSVAIGISSFLATLSFQFGNNLGIGMGMETLTGIEARIWPFVFTFFAVLLIFYTKRLYRVLEKLMMYMVIIMILAFVANVLFIRPDMLKVAQGFVPRTFAMQHFDQLAALVGTTFVLNSALYQSYLVQTKGWGLKDKAKAIQDSNFGVFILASISLLVIVTAAATLKPLGIHVNSAADMALQLELLLGQYAKYIFAIGFSAAAFSSLVINAVVGGGLLSDGLGMGQSMENKMPRIFTVTILLIGMGIAIYVSSDIGNPVYSLIIAQASSILAVPLIAVGLILVLNRKDIMGEHRNNTFQNVLATLGFLLMCILVYIMVTKLLTYFKIV